VVIVEASGAGDQERGAGDVRRPRPADGATGVDDRAHGPESVRLDRLLDVRCRIGLSSKAWMQLRVGSLRDRRPVGANGPARFSESLVRSSRSPHGRRRVFDPFDGYGALFTVAVRLGGPLTAGVQVALSCTGT
jgi:hypothetical protein